MNKDDEQSNERRADLQSRQIDEQIAMGRRINVSEQREEALIDEFYGPSVEILTNEIDAINTRLHQPGIKGFIHRSLKGAKEREDLKNAQRSLQNVEGRMEEMRQVIRINQFSTTENMAVKHDIQRENLEMDIHNPSMKPKSQSVSLPSISLDYNLSLNDDLSKGRSR